MSSAPAVLRVATYNVHGCVGTDKIRSERRIADVIRSLDLDVVGLQELDLNRTRSARANQLSLITAALGWSGHFFPAFKREEEEYGDAIISRFQLRVRKSGELPAKAPWFCRESRGAIWAAVETPTGPCHVINTHFGLGRRERLIQAKLLAAADWIGAAPDEPLIVMGDFNCGSASPAIGVLVNALQSGYPTTKPPPTFPSGRPLLAIDHVLVNKYLRVSRLHAVSDPIARIASDHLPLVAELIVIPRWARGG